MKQVAVTNATTTATAECEKQINIFKLNAKTSTTANGVEAKMFSRRRPVGRLDDKNKYASELDEVPLEFLVASHYRVVDYFPDVNCELSCLYGPGARCSSVSSFENNLCMDSWQR